LRVIEITGNAYEIAQKLSYPRGQAYSAGYMGFAYYMLSNHELALAKFKEGARSFRHFLLLSNRGGSGI
jgi:hypothetical protein